MNIRMETVAGNIRREREKRNLTISGLAERANLSASCISKAEMAKSSVSLKSLIKIAAALDVPVAELLEIGDAAPENEKLLQISGEGHETGEYSGVLEQIMENLPEEMEDFLVEITRELMCIFKKERKMKGQADKK
ncbi:MAG: helix-turn-helix transcriptional regulator [Eubacterium sp.]|nr:helix-turn-helix transcriptional regulator [Eubacterium sp.]